MEEVDRGCSTHIDPSQEVEESEEKSQSGRHSHDEVPGQPS